MDVLKQSVTQAPAPASPGPGIGHRLWAWVAGLHAGQLTLLCLGCLVAWIAVTGAVLLAVLDLFPGGSTAQEAVFAAVMLASLALPGAAVAALWVWFGARRTP